jgi:hypothetical protein
LPPSRRYHLAMTKTTTPAPTKIVRIDIRSIPQEAASTIGAPAGPSGHLWRGWRAPPEVLPSEGKCQKFESSRARHKINDLDFLTSVGVPEVFRYGCPRV